MSAGTPAERAGVPMANGIAILTAVVLSMGSPGARADSWSAATVKTVASESGDIVVRVTPGNSIGDTYGFSGAPRGKFASAQWFRYRDGRYEPYQTAVLLNPVAPLQVAVADDGAVVTLDNWHNVGYGEVVVIYGSDGKVRQKYGLKDLYPVETIEEMVRSTSSIWWRCTTDELKIDRGNAVRIDDTLGGRLTFQLGSGKRGYEAGAGKCRKP